MRRARSSRIARTACSVLATASVVVASGVGLAAPAFAATAPTLSAANTFPLPAGGSGPVGDVVLTEAAPGQLQVGDVLTYLFRDAGAATLHFATAGTLSATNGLAGTVALASSSGTLDDEMKVTVTQASSGAFPGQLTLSGLTATADSTAVAGSDSVTVTDSNVAVTPPSPASIADATIISSGTSHATFAAQSTPTILSTGNQQSVGSVTITEPAKDFFHTGDVITLAVRDTNGGGDTIGLAGAPLAAGGSMTVSVSGTNGASVQTNDTAFNVNVNAQDPSNGSTSTLTISNLVLNTAEAPIGPVTLSAVVTSPGGASATEPIAPGRVTVASVGGNTNTTATGTPALTVGATGQPAGNVQISVAAASLSHSDTFSLQVQTPGVTFTAADPPTATVTSGNLVLQNAAAVVDGTGTTATWTVASGNSEASNIVVGPIYYDVAGAATTNTAVTLLASGETGSAFTTQHVSDAVIAPSASHGRFAAVGAPPSAGAAPFSGANVTYTETATGSTPNGSTIVLVAPDATQIAAYRTTFAAVPSVSSATGGMTLGTPTVNSSAVVVSTSAGSITAPAQTVLSIPVTAASTTGPASFTISGLQFQLGSLAVPGALVVTGVVQSGGGAIDGNQIVDLINTRNLGTTSATTPPTVTLTQTPPAESASNHATFAFSSDQPGTTYACALDGQVISLNCPTPITLPGLTDGSHQFTVQGFNQAGYSSTPVTYTWNVDTVAPTVSAFSAPTASNGPAVITFDKPVTDVSTSTVTLTAVGPGTASAPVTVTLLCSDGTSAPAACTPADTVKLLEVVATGGFVPGQHYSLVLNPVGATPAIQDAAGLALASTTESFRGPLTVQQTDPAAVASWQAVSTSKASGGNYVQAHLAGATASYSFTGSSVTWLTETGPNMGYATVSIDGAKVATVDNYSKTSAYRVSRAVTGLASGAHMLRITVSGKKGSTAATDSQVAVDGFVVGGVTQQQTAATYGWSPVAASKASGGSYAQDDLAGASVSMTFRGTGVTWWTVDGPTMGKANLYVDGHLVGSYDGYASSVVYGKSHSVSKLADGLHTVTVKVLGTHRTGAKGSRVAVDRFTVS